MSSAVFQRPVCCETLGMLFFEPIFPEIWISTTAIRLRDGESGGRLDPHAGELISIRDSNRGRGEDDQPTELSGNHNMAVLVAE